MLGFGNLNFPLSDPKMPAACGSADHSGLTMHST